MFDVKTRNGSVVTPKIAGIESTAKIEVRDLDEHQHEQQRRRERRPVLDDEEMLARDTGR